MENLEKSCPENKNNKKLYRIGAEILLSLQLTDSFFSWKNVEVTLDPEYIQKFADDLEVADGILRDSPGDAYRVFQIPKTKDTFRTIESPTGPAVMRKVRTSDGEGKIESILEKVQSQIGRALHGIPFGDSAICAFRRNHSAYSGLRFMIDQFLWQEGVSFRDKKNADWSQWVLRETSASRARYPEKSRAIAGVYQIDIANFFPSVLSEWGEETLLKTLTSFLQNHSKMVDENDLKEVVALIMRLTSYEWRLPQWAPSSPIIANMVANNRFDNMIPARLGWKEQRVYGRYADDIVLLSNIPISLEVRQRVDSVIEDSGFRIHEDKRVYEEWELTYSIWGTSLLAERRDVLDRGGYHSHTFRIRSLMAEHMAEEIFSLMDRVKTEDIQDGQSFHENTEVKRMLGLFSHAFNVSRFGGEWQESRNIYKHRRYAFPRPILFAWEIFKKHFWQFLSENQKETSFTVARGDPIFDIRRNNATTLLEKRW